MSAIALAVAAGGAAKASKTTVLMTGTEGVEAMKKADVVAKTYKPTFPGFGVVVGPRIAPPPGAGNGKSRSVCAARVEPIS
jgi:hypothetical protein